MSRFVEGADRQRSTLFPDRLDNWVDENNPIRVIEALIDALDLGELGFKRIDPKATGDDHTIHRIC